METNLGTVDRALRAALGILLIGLSVSGEIGLWGYIGAVSLLTAVAGYCPAYALLGIESHGRSQRSAAVPSHRRAPPVPPALPADAINEFEDHHERPSDADRHR